MTTQRDPSAHVDEAEFKTYFMEVTESEALNYPEYQGEDDVVTLEEAQ